MGAQAAEGGELKPSFCLPFKTVLREGGGGGFGLVRDKYKLPFFILVGSDWLGSVLDRGDFAKQVYIHSKESFSSLHGRDFIIMPDDALDGNFQGKSLTALTACWYTQPCW